MDEINTFGIDLGTTNSAIAIWNPQTGEADVLPNLDGQRLTPSVVTFDSATGSPIVGKQAAARMLDQPNEVFYSVKRFIGRTFRDQWVSYDQQQVTYGIEETSQQKVIIRKGDSMLTPPQISAEVLRKLKADSQVAMAGRRITRAVVTVPAYFNDSQRQATKEACELAGLQIPRIINEPTAAALAFGLGSEPQTVAVYDLGGGTFDMSILRVENGLFRVKATSGDTHLGGDDFDLAICDWIRREFERRQGVALPLADDPQLRARLRKEAERGKIALSTATEVRLHLPDVLTADGRAHEIELTLTRSDLDTLIQPLIRRTLDACDKVLAEARLRPDQIDQLLLIGGQTRTPAIEKAIRERYGWKINRSVNPDEAVARGAAMLGARLDGYLKGKVKLWDVIPLSIGIELASGEMDVIFRANEQIPTTAKKIYTAPRDGQERIRFRIHQGERPTVAGNVLLGQVVLNLATARPGGEHRVSCVLKVDHDGILHVRAQESDVEGKPVEATFDRVYRMTQEEVEAVCQEAESRRVQDALTIRLLRLREEMDQVRRAVEKDQQAGEALLGRLADLAAAIEAGDPDRGDELLADIREMF